jgi:hypothetical protein
MIKIVIAIIIGGIIGFAYYKLIGCSSGACPITSNPYTSILYGAFLGFLVGQSFR